MDGVVWMVWDGVGWMAGCRRLLQNAGQWLRRLNSKSASASQAGPGRTSTRPTSTGAAGRLHSS